MNKKTIEFLRRKATLIPAFDNISNAVFDRLLSISTLVKFHEEQIVVSSGGRVEDIYIILSGRCEVQHQCAENRMIRKELSATDVLGSEALFLPSLESDQIKAITELICVKISLANIRADQEIVHSLTPNLTRNLIRDLREADNKVSKLIEQYVEPELIKDDVEPHLIIDRNSKLTRMMLSNGRIVVISKPDERRLRRQEVTTQQLNQEYLTKLLPELELIAKQG
jgi:CRP-like cAMP-binding protein